MKKAFRIFAAFSLLAIYLSMMVGGGIVSLTCRCRHHHPHAAETHVSVCAHHHHDCDKAVCPAEGFEFSDDCTCSLHSTEVALYTQPRQADDNDDARNTTAGMSAVLLPSYTGSEMPDRIDISYGEYLTPFPEAILARGISLRAPPVSA